MNRAFFLPLLSLLLIPTNVLAALPPDVDAEDAFAPSIETLFDVGIIPAGDFRPDAEVTRSELADLLGRATGVRKKETRAGNPTRVEALQAVMSAFEIGTKVDVPTTWSRPDVRRTQWFAPVIYRAGKLGFIPTSGRADPFGTPTRAEVAVMIARARDVQGLGEFTTQTTPTVTIRVGGESSGKFSLLDQVLGILKENYLYADKIDQKKMIYSAVQGLVEAIDDPYTEFMPPAEAEIFNSGLESEFAGIGAYLTREDGKLIIVTPIAGTPSEKAGLRAGDEIIAIDGADVADMTLIQATTRIRGETGSTVTLRIKRAGSFAERDFAVVRGKIVVASVSWSWADEAKKIAKVQLIQFGDGTTREMAKVAGEIKDAGVQGIILDLRNDPGGLLDASIDAASYFLPSGETVAQTRNRAGDLTTYVSNQDGPFKSTPLVVLVNKGTASAAEILAGALRDLRGAEIIGETTFGKGVAQLVTPFTDGSTLKFTISEWLTPSGGTINHVGIVPDVVVTESQVSTDASSTRGAGAAARRASGSSSGADPVLARGLLEIRRLVK